MQSFIHGYISNCIELHRSLLQTSKGLQNSSEFHRKLSVDLHKTSENSMAIKAFVENPIENPAQNSTVNSMDNLIETSIENS